MPTRGFWFVVASVCIIAGIVYGVSAPNDPVTSGQFIAGIGVILFALVSMTGDDDE